MKLETGDSCRVARGKLDTGNSRSGIALIMTLTIMALLLILALAFMTNMRSERQVSFNYRRQVEARQAALAGLHTAIARMGRFYTDAEAANAAVATMAGRFYYTNGVDKTLAVADGLPTGSYTAYKTNNMLMFSWIMGPLFGGGGGNTNLADKVNMNGGNYSWPVDPDRPGAYLPIANACVNPNRPGWGPDKVGVWAAYLLSNANRTGCKFAFWIDDESSKINISNAYTRDLSGAGANNVTNFTSTGVGSSAATQLPYARIVQPNGAFGKNVSSVDLQMLDVGTVCPSAPYNQDGPNWTDPATLNSIDTARNSGTWQPFLAPDEVLGLAGSRLTMKDYQAVKSCLTAWSAENEDRAQLFRKSNNTAITRTNVSATIPVDAMEVPAFAQLKAKTLYEFLMIDCQLDTSISAGTWFGSATFSNKFSDVYQPLTNGSVQQIVANIVSYISNPARVVPLGSTPPTVFPDISHDWDPKTQTRLPTGACGLWKAAYMNEIALALCWQPIQPPPPALMRWQLWASLYVELINPYEVPLPNLALGQQYRLFLDGNVAITCNLQAPATPSSLSYNWTTNDIAITSATQIAPHSYTSPDLPGTSLNCFQWPIGGQIVTNTQPKITSITVSLPQIRQTMECGDQHLKGIIDWSMATNLTVTLQQPGQSAVVSSLTGNPPPTSAEFWRTENPNPNRAQWSIAKNDPRVRVWYGPYSFDNVTVKGYRNVTGLNTPSVNFTGGDAETPNGTYAPNADKPEYRSNFVIAESGMKSIGELGFIHTGKPWRSLSMQAYGNQPDEIGASSNKKIADWAILDLFSVNSLPIYGRININNGGWHLGNNANGTANYNSTRDLTYPSFEDRSMYPVHPNLLATWSDAGNQNRLNTIANYQWCYITMRVSAYNRFQYNPVTDHRDSASVPIAAALSVIPNPLFRNRLANYISYHWRPLNSQKTLFAPLADPSDTTFVPNRDIWNPYYTVGQICEVPYIDRLFTGDGSQLAYTDADKEDTVRRIINVLTTRGDVFTVNASGIADSGEARLQAVVERIHDTTTAAPIAYRNRFRIRQIRWITE